MSIYGMKEQRVAEAMAWIEGQRQKRPCSGCRAGPVECYGRLGDVEEWQNVTKSEVGMLLWHVKAYANRRQWLCKVCYPIWKVKTFGLDKKVKGPDLDSLAQVWKARALRASDPREKARCWARFYALSRTDKHEPIHPITTETEEPWFGPTEDL